MRFSFADIGAPRALPTRELHDNRGFKVDLFLLHIVTANGSDFSLTEYVATACEWLCILPIRSMFVTWRDHNWNSNPTKGRVGTFLIKEPSLRKQFVECERFRLMLLGGLIFTDASLVSEGGISAQFFKKGLNAAQRAISGCLREALRRCEKQVSTTQKCVFHIWLRKITSDRRW